MANPDLKREDTEEKELREFALRVARQLKLAPEENTPPSEIWICGKCAAPNMKDNPDCWDCTIPLT